MGVLGTFLAWALKILFPSVPGKPVYGFLCYLIHKLYGGGFNNY